MSPAGASTAGTPLASRLLLAMTLVFGFLLAVAQITHYDVWALLAGGRYIVAHGLPATDPFSYTAVGRPWPNQSWLTQVLFYLAYDRLGRVPVILLKGLLAATTLGLAWRTARRRSGSPAAAAVAAGLAALALAPWWHLRPQLFTYLAWAAWLALYEAWRGGRGRALWGLPLVMAAWVNLHAGFALGLAALALWGSGLVLETRMRRTERAGRAPAGAPEHGLEPRPAGAPAGPGDRAGGSAGPPPSLLPLAGAAALALVATLLNPWGWRALLFPLELTTSRSALGASVDWYSPNFLDPALLPALAAVGLLVLGLAVAPSRPRVDEALLLVFLLGVSLRSGRNLPLLLLAATPLLARFAADLGAGAAAWSPRLRPAGGPLALVLLAAGSVGVLAWTRPLDRNPFVQELNEARYPVQAVRFIRAHRLPAPLFNTYLWAGYELWALPEYRVFIDNRMEVYPPAVIRDYLAATYASPGWQEVLARWQVRTLLVGRHSVLAAALRDSPRWVGVFDDREASVFLGRADPETAALLARLGRPGPGAGSPGS
jgi:hypothetical protein